MSPERVPEPPVDVTKDPLADLFPDLVGPLSKSLEAARLAISAKNKLYFGDGYGALLDFPSSKAAKLLFRYREEISELAEEDEFVLPLRSADGMKFFLDGDVYRLVISLSSWPDAKNEPRIGLRRINGEKRAFFFCDEEGSFCSEYEAPDILITGYVLDQLFDNGVSPSEIRESFKTLLTNILSKVTESNRLLTAKLEKVGCKVGDASS